jgi:hypothetical protein
LVIEDKGVGRTSGDLLLGWEYKRKNEIFEGF